MRRRVTVVGLSVCVSVKSHLTSGVSVRPENTVTYSAGNEGQNICGVFSETAPLRRSSTPSIESHAYGPPFFPRIARMRINACGSAEGSALQCISFESSTVYIGILYPLKTLYKDFVHFHFQFKVGFHFMIPR